MISKQQRHTYSPFGPCSSPLYYTALSRVPNRLVFAGLGCGSVCRIVLTSSDSGASVQRSIQAYSENGICSWPLTGVPSCPGMLCTWQIEEGDKLNEVKPPCEKVEQGKVPPREGRFRVISSESRDRLNRGRQRLGRVGGDQFSSSANALFLAEFGMYHDALLMVEANVASQSNRNSLLLARTVQTLIYKQMLRQIQDEQLAQTARVSRLDWYNTWTVNRERYHRDLSIALMKGNCPRRCLKEVAA